MGAIKIISILSGTLGFGAVGTLGAHQMTSKTIKDAYDNCLPENIEAEANGFWKKAYENWNSINPKNDPIFKDLTDTDNTGKSLRNLCLDSYKKTYYNLFQGTNSSLLSSVNKYCSLTIKDSLDKEKIINISDTKQEANKEALIKTYKKLFETNESSKIEKDSELFKIKKDGSADNAEQKWKELENWCIGSYKGKYTGNNEQLELIKAYCLKE